MSAVEVPDYNRERQLIEKLEFRIASASTGDKLQDILSKFLAPLILKLATDDVQNRNLTIKICQYINQRLKIDETILVPVEALSKTFATSNNAFVKQFCLLFMQQGFPRLSPDRAKESLPSLVNSACKDSVSDRSDAKIYALVLGLFLETLPHWKFPERLSKEDIALADAFHLTDRQKHKLSASLTNYLLYDARSALDSDVQEDEATAYASAVQNRSRIVPGIAAFLFTSVLSDEARFVPATVLAVDANAEAASRADVIFKQFSFDLESDVVVDAAFNLYNKAKTKLKTRILNILSRSQKSTTRTSEIVNLVEEQLALPASNLEALKLRAAMFSYLIWATRINPEIGKVSHELIRALREFIEAQGWPEPAGLSVQDLNLRGLAYEAITLVAAIRKADEVTAVQFPMTDLINWLFTSLRCDTSRDVRHSIEDGLGRLMGVVDVQEQSDSFAYKELLRWHVSALEGDVDSTYHQPTKYVTQFAAIRFANKIFPFSDNDARLMDVIATASNRRETAEEAQRGLDPYWYAMSSRWESTGTNLQLPTFSDFGPLVCKNNLAPSSISGAVKFCRLLLVNEAWAGSIYALEFDATWQSRMDANLRGDQRARELLKAYLKCVPEDSLAALILLALRGMSANLADCGEIAYELLSLSPNTIVSLLLKEGTSICLELTSNVKLQQHTSKIFALLASLSADWQSFVSQDINTCTSWASAVGQQSITINSSLLRAGRTLARAQLRGTSSDAQLLARLLALAKQILTESKDRALRTTAYTVIGEVLLSIHTPSLKIFQLLPSTDIVFADAKKEDEVAVAMLGKLVNFRLSLASRVQDGDSAVQEKCQLRTEALYDREGESEASLSALLQMMSARMMISSEESESNIPERLIDLCEVRKAEFHFALGEALSVSALGYRSSAIITELDIDIATPSFGYNADYFSDLLRLVVEKAKSPKPALRKASGIWLLSLIQFCTEPDLVRPMLRECQAVFSRHLNDRDEVVQETGSRGLGLVYEKGDKILREDLVRDLVQSFTGTSAKMSGTVSEETQLFEAGALPTENGQSVTTYKDIVGLAQEMGDPSLVYRFMNLASNNAIWSSRAAFGRFGLSNVLSDSSYLKENKKFYPKLFRYRFDPNPNVQRSMNDIWKALVKDPTTVIDENFDMIMEDLLKSVILGKEWRAREASCAAIADLVQGREVEKFERYLDDIWTNAFKVLDDVKESVRVAAMKLCRTLTGMLIRNLEVGEGTTKRAQTMLHHALPFLLQQMETGAAKDVQQYAVVTLLEIVKKAPSPVLRPFAPVILQTLVNALSSLEHESINYLHLNADKYGLTADKLDEMRVSSINASPVTEAIDSCLESLAGAVINKGDDAEIGESAELKDAMLRLEACFKTTIGLPSKIGLSRVFITLVVRHHAAFRPYASRFIQIVRKSVLDRNATISQSFSLSLAYLLRLSQEKEVRKTIEYAKKLYFTSEELSHRAVAGEIVQAISKASNDVFMSFAPDILPFAYVGRNDLDEDCRNRFDIAWKDNVGGSRALHLYLREIIEILSKHIKSSLWPIRHACCFAVANLVSAGDGAQQFSQMEAMSLWPLVDESLSGKTWTGKARVVATFPTFVKRAQAIWPDASEKMFKLAVREAKRSNIEYRPAAISSLADFASIRPDIDIAEDIYPFLVETLDAMNDPDSMDIDSDVSEKAKINKLATDTIVSIVKCTFACVRLRFTKALFDEAVSVIQKSRAQSSRPVAFAFYEGFQTYLNILSTSEGTNDVQGSPAKLTSAQITSHGEFLQKLTQECLVADSASHVADPETLRSSKANTCLKLAKSNILNTETRRSLHHFLRSWLDLERLRSVRLIVDQAVQANNSAPT